MAVDGRCRTEAHETRLGGLAVGTPVHSNHIESGGLGGATRGKSLIGMVGATGTQEMGRVATGATGTQMLDRRAEGERDEENK